MGACGPIVIIRPPLMAWTWSLMSLGPSLAACGCLYQRVTEPSLLMALEIPGC
jgi:hypothetical protein